MPRLGKILPSLRLVRNALSTVGLQGSVHRLSQFPTHTWLLCFGVLIRQSNVDVTHRISTEASSTHVCDGNQERGLQLEKRLPDT